MDDDDKAWRLTARSIDATNRQTMAMFCILAMMIVAQTCFLGWLEYDSRWRYGQEIRRVVTMSQNVRVEQRTGLQEDLQERVLKGEFHDVRRIGVGHREATGSDHSQ
jgi:cell division protein FtsX